MGKKNTEPLLIAERLGHESIETTLQTSSQLYPNKQIEVANRLAQMSKVDKPDEQVKSTCSTLLVRPAKNKP